MDRGEGADSSPWKSPKREMNPLTFHGLAPRSSKFDVLTVDMKTVLQESSVPSSAEFARVSQRSGTEPFFDL